MPKLFNSRWRFGAKALVVALLCGAVASAGESPKACLIETIAGGGRSFSGDGGPAVAAEFDGLTDAVAASDGTIYAADSRNGRIRRITPDGVVTTLAGPEQGLIEPTRLAITPDGLLFVYDGGARRIWRISATGVVEPLLDLRLARTEHLGEDLGLAAGADGEIYIASPETNRVWRLDSDGNLAPFAGTGEPGEPEANGDGGPAMMATLNEPRDVDIGPDGLVYIAETGFARVRRVNADSSIETALSLLPDAAGTRGSYASFLLGSIRSFEPVPSRPLRIAVGDGRIDAVVAGTSAFGGLIPGIIDVGLTSVPLQVTPDVTGLLRPYPGAADSTSVYRYFSDGDLLIASVGLPDPRSVAPMPDGQLLVADSRDQLWAVSAEPDAVRDLSGLAFPAARPERIAGLGAAGPAGDGGPASEARLFSPREVVARRSGEIFIADATRVRWIDRSGIIRALPGDLPNAHLAVDPKDNVYIATGQAIFKMRASGLMERIASFERCESSESECGDGGPVRSAKFFGFGPMAAGSDGTVYMLESGPLYPGFYHDSAPLTPEKEQFRVFDLGGSSRLRTISPNGEVGTAIPQQQLFSTNPTIGPDAAGGILLSSSVQDNLWRIEGSSRQFVTGSARYVDSPFHASPSGLVGAPDGTIYFSRDNTMRRLSPSGVINTIAGRVGRPGYSGDGGLATEALLSEPAHLALTAQGDLLIADPGAGAVRVVRDPASCAPVVRPQIHLDGVRKVSRGSGGSGPFAVGLLGWIGQPIPPPTFAPGSMITISGERLGPTPAAELDSASLDRLPLGLGGVSVEIDGRPAPLLFASSGLIIAIVPAKTTTSGQAYLRVTVDGVSSDEAVLAMQPSAPSVLYVLNADGSPNSEAQPAPIDSEVTVLVSGLGVEGIADPGVIARESRPLASEGVSITVGETDIAVEAVETAPGFPESVVAVEVS